MVFVPFTGIDNHKRSVTFGAGLLSREDTYSYTWLLQAFLKTFKKQPILILSDQDAAMKKAIEDVFSQSNHRLCMWHITSKLSNKVSNETYHEKNFKKKFSLLVWNSRLTTEQFEEGWNEFINEYELHDNRWFKDMFSIRDQWIPSYFKHIAFAGLTRTTSRSESENAAFQKSVDPGTSLVDFMISFESSMERQRFKQCNLDFDDVHKYPPKKTILYWKKRDYNYYTKDIFFQVQIELYHALYNCSQWDVTKDGTNEIWCVREKKNRSVVLDGNTSKKVAVPYGYIEWDSNIHQNDFKVICNVPQNYFSCSCKLFERFGILCRHIFCLLKWYNIEDIHNQYLIRRWSKNLIPIEKLMRTFRYGDLDEDADKMAIDVFLSVDKCLSALSSNKEHFSEYLQCLKDLEDRFIGSSSNNSSGSKTVEYDNLLGVSTPDEITIQNLDGIRNKGCGKRTRMKSSPEMAAIQKTKEPHTCNYCHQKVYHDIRNCPLRIADQQPTSSKKNN